MTTTVRMEVTLKVTGRMTMAQANSLAYWLNDKLLEEAPIELEWANVLVDEVEVD